MFKITRYKACLSEDNIPPSLYEGLIETVHENLKPLHEYIALKKEILGLDEFHAYDTVSYTHLDVYKRQTHISSESFSTLTGSVLHAILPALQPGHG